MEFDKGKKMKGTGMMTYRFSTIAGTLLTAGLLGLPLSARSIGDEDLLRMLEAADRGPAQAVDVQPESAAVEPADQPVETADNADAPVIETRSAPAGTAAAMPAMTNAAVEKVDVAEEVPKQEAPAGENIIDDFGMSTFDDQALTSGEELISVRLDEVSLEKAISLFAQVSGANIIIPELSEATKVSVNLKDVEWRPALQTILDSYNYELYQKVPGSNVYSVRRRPEGAPEPQVVETFSLKYATVPLVAEMVAGLLPAEAKVSQFASRNMLVIKSTESSLNEVRAVIEAVDRVRQQVFIESKFMELGDKAQRDLGIDWQVLQAYSMGTRGPTTKSYSDSRSDSRESTSFVDALGRPFADGSGFSDGDTLDGNFPVYEGLTPLVKNMDVSGSSSVLTSVLDADQFRLILSALQGNRGVNVVSNPKIIVANEEKANISLVRKEPNLKQERQQTAGASGGAAIDNIVFELDPETPWFEYGIKLDVTPSINTTSNITVKINPSLTRFVENKQAGDNTYPIIDEKSVETVFSLSNGQTAAIGGLTEITDSKVERKVPLLGDIPLLGRLFSWEQTVSEQKETIIFVTVGLANTQNIGLESGLPEDSELARRRLITDQNKRVLRDEGRRVYRAEEKDKLDDALKTLDDKETRRVEKRRETIEGETRTVASVE